VLLVGFKTEALKPLTGRTLVQIAQDRGRDPWQTALYLIQEDGTLLAAVFFQMSEEQATSTLRRHSAHQSRAKP
jgi:N-acyl-D-amino-acid deacylase